MGTFLFFSKNRNVPIFLRLTAACRRFAGSLAMAFALLLTIGAVLAWGTMYEARFGTAAAQRVIYQSWWFQSLLAFLAVNLAVAAFQRWPWRRAHAPFLLAHLGIILILLGGIVGGRFGFDGQLIIPEGRSERLLQLSQKALTVTEPNPGIPHVYPTSFEAAAWRARPDWRRSVPLEHGILQLRVDRYLPDGVMEERVTADGPAPNPALRLTLRHGDQAEAVWLLSRDPARASAQWGDALVLFLDLGAEADWDALAGPVAGTGRGEVLVRLPGAAAIHRVPVPPSVPAAPQAVGETPYTVTFREFLPDFVITAEGVRSRSDEPNNPAVSLLLTGPEGSDAHLLFARHPDFSASHGIPQVLPASLRYEHPAVPSLPGTALVLAQVGGAERRALWTDAAGQPHVLGPAADGQTLRHPAAGVDVTIEEAAPRAAIAREARARSRQVRRELLHVTGEIGAASDGAWVEAGAPARLSVGGTPVLVAYGPAQRALPFSVKLLDFRKIDYPGTDMAAGFESDVELTDPTRGLILMRTIKMNEPLRYRGYSLYQASFSLEPVETTVLAVRNDPGTPLVYAGFLTIIGGIVGMFAGRRGLPPILGGPRP
jgi:hypothetical protein